MTGSFASWIVQGYLAPQKSVRQLLDANHGWDVAALLMLLGYLIGAIAILIISPESASKGGLVGHIGGIISTAIQFMITTFLVLVLGKMAGGTGTLPQALLAMGWYTFVSSFLFPLVVKPMNQLALAMSEATATGAPPEIDGGSLFLAMFAGMTSIWLFANAVAALHGFRSLWGVLGVVMGIPMAIAVLAVLGAGG